MPTAPNSVVMKSEQDIILERDASAVSERINHFFIRPYVALNFGLDALVNASYFKLLAEPPRDQLKGIERAERTIALGVPVAVNQVRELSGMREPEDDEAIVVAPQTASVAPSFDTVSNADDAAARLPGMEDGGVDGADARAQSDVNGEPAPSPNGDQNGGTVIN